MWHRRVFAWKAIDGQIQIGPRWEPALSKAGGIRCGYVMVENWPGRSFRMTPLSGQGVGRLG